MDVGLLLLLNLSTAPFLFEFEKLGCRANVRPSLAATLRLSNFRRARWALGFAVFWAIFLALVLAPSASGVRHQASIGLVLVLLAIQAALWVFVVLRTKRLQSETR
jgi:hypothetical protein